jgi:acyl carrier protein
MEENLIYKIEILQLLENKYDIEIKDEEVEYIGTFDDLIKLIQEKQVTNGSRL